MKMKIIKKYTAIQLFAENVNDREVKPRLTFGKVGRRGYYKTYPQKIFNSEEDAIEYAYKKDSQLDWLIVPIISFNHY